MENINTQRQLAALRLVAKIARLNPSLGLGLLSDNILLLQKLAKSLRNRYEAECNHAWASGEKWDKATRKKEDKAIELAKTLGITLEIQSDPRGWPFIFSCDGGKEIGRLG